MRRIDLNSDYIKSVDVEPCCCQFRKTYLEILNKFGYLSTSECYKFIINFKEDINIDNINDVAIMGLKQSSTADCGCIKKYNKNLEFFIRFGLPLEEFKFKFVQEEKSSKDDKRIPLDCEFYIKPLKFTTLFTFNNLRFTIFFSILFGVLFLYL